MGHRGDIIYYRFSLFLGRADLHGLLCFIRRLWRCSGGAGGARSGSVHVGRGLACLPRCVREAVVLDRTEEVGSLSVTSKHRDDGGGHSLLVSDIPVRRPRSSILYGLPHTFHINHRAGRWGRQ